MNWLLFLHLFFLRKERHAEITSLKVRNNVPLKKKTGVN